MERMWLDLGVDKLLRLSIRPLSDVNYNWGKTADRYLAAGSLHPSQVFSHEMFLQFYKLLSHWWIIPQPYQSFASSSLIYRASRTVLYIIVFLLGRANLSAIISQSAEGRQSDLTAKNHGRSGKVKWGWQLW